MHELKIEKQFADAILDGRKTFEVRRNDRGYNAGDTVRFTVLEDGVPIQHKLIGAEFRIGYVLSGWGIEEGFVAFSIAPVYDEGSARRGRMRGGSDGRG